MYAIRLGSQPAPAALPVPVAGVKPVQLADTWGGARSGGRRHEGIDIFAKRGTPVLSSTEGIVLRVGTNRLGGQVVWVLGPGGQRHYYAHLDRYGDVRAGMRVRHRQFGVGTVVDVEDHGDDYKVTVRFPSVGTKKLLARFAGLEPA